MTWVDTLPSAKVEGWVEKFGEMAMRIHGTDDARFALWLTYVDKAVARRVMVSYRDLEDWDYRSAYEADATPVDAAEEMLEELGWSL